MRWEVLVCRRCQLPLGVTDGEYFWPIAAVRFARKQTLPCSSCTALQKWEPKDHAGMTAAPAEVVGA